MVRLERALDLDAEVVGLLLRELGQLRAEVAEVQARFAEGRWKTDVSEHMKLSDVVSGLADALKKTDGKVMITP